MSLQVNGVDTPAIFTTGGLMPGGKIWTGTAVTNASGLWSIAFPSAGFTAPPVVFVTAQSTDATTTNAAHASLNGGATTATGASGLVTLPNTITVGGSPVKAAGAGLVVNVIAIGG